ncbi:MAG: metal ABC transporter substrate-binding protein [Roseimicrobium sp.]
MKTLSLACLAFLSSAAFAADEKLLVAVANEPLKYFAEKIGDDHVQVIFPAPADEDPAFWQPKDADIAAYQSADLILMNGATYSKWAEKATLPRAKTIDTSASFKKSFIIIKEASTHSHGPGGEHSHAGTAFTTWIDCQQAIAQAQAVRDALVKKRPAAQADFDKEFNELREDLLKIDKRLLAVGKALNGQPLVASHPVYQYLARRYGLNLKEVLWEPEAIPTDKQMAELQAILAKHPAKWMIWEGEPAKESVEKIAALGLQSTVFAPSGNAPDRGEWLEAMQRNVKALERVAGL